MKWSRHRIDPTPADPQLMSPGMTPAVAFVAFRHGAVHGGLVDMGSPLATPLAEIPEPFRSYLDALLVQRGGDMSRVWQVSFFATEEPGVLRPVLIEI